MSIDVCKDCRILCNLGFHHCEEWEVWFDGEDRKFADCVHAPDAELAAEKWGERCDDERNWIDNPNVVCVAKPGSLDIKRFSVSAETRIDYCAHEVTG